MNVAVICNTLSSTITFKLPEKTQDANIYVESGGILKELPVIRKSASFIECDASSLKVWTPETPVLYNIVVKDGETETRFRTGYRSLESRGNKVLLNGRSYYFRGYIRGIVAHDHPNMTGGDDADAYRKNILQAKKYGFNLVRFHSTVPDKKFVETADELGLLVHMEIGFSYKFNEKGEKEERFFDTEKWISTLKEFRNNPSVMIFCIGNEMHNSGKEPQVREFYDIAKKFAPNTLMMDNTGWGEYDRLYTDLFAQHIAYFFPFKEHANMFKEDFYWKKNGSVSDLELNSESEYSGGKADIERRLNPVRPVMAHETVHYIEIPDYEKLNAKFDKFASEVGEEYLKKHNIEKPRYLTELPALIESKGLKRKLPDYIKASEHFKKAGTKVYFEALRAAENICGFEMLQLSDCLKYENKNGLIDFFDDDKYISPEWFRRINSDDVLLADLPERTFFTDQKVSIPFIISHYSPEPIMNASFEVFLGADGKKEKVYQGSGYNFVYNGVLPVGDMSVNFSKFTRNTEISIEAVLSFKNADGKGTEIKNQWELWVYTKPEFQSIPELRLSEGSLEKFIKERSSGSTDSDCVFTDTLDERSLSDLENGNTVILYYDGIKAVGNAPEYYWPGTFDRFKPCIWDRGHNLGGIIYPEFLQKKIGGRYFDLNMYDVVQSGYKINLDSFPCEVNEIISGADKPVRDRMKGLIQKIKDFLPEQTLRNFSYLFSVKAGKGNLIVCTFNLKNARKPVCGAVLSALFNDWRELLPSERQSVSVDVLRQYLKENTRKGPEQEDVMNRFWAEDDRPVEDQLFWENAGIDLSKLH